MLQRYWTRESDSSLLVVVLQVVKFARDKWLGIGHYLGFKVEELDDYEKEPKSMHQCLFHLLVDWKKTVQQLGLLSQLVKGRRWW